MQLRQWLPQIGVLQELMADRGYVSVTSVRVGSDPLHLCSARDASGSVVAVFLTNENKTGVKTVRKLREEGAKQGARRVILLCPDGLTPFAVREVRATQPSDAQGRHPSEACYLEVFKKHELAFNVTKHALVPRHRIVPSSEKKQLLADLACKAGALPKIKEGDPVVRYLGCPVGTVLAIERTIGQLEPETYYRIVVA